MATVDAGGRTVEYKQVGEGPDVLLIHSLLTDLTAFEKVAQRLSRGRRTTSINLPGYGSSSPANLVDVAEYAEHITKVMDALELANSTDVFGDGLGGFIGLALSANHGARFNRLIVADVLATLPDEEKASLGALEALAKDKEKGMHAVSDAAMGKLFSVGFEQAHPEVVADRKEKLGNKVDREAFARACAALAKADLSGKLEKVGSATLVLCGDVNPVTPPDLAKDLAKSIKNAVFFPISECAQCPMLEQPATLAALIEEFLLIKR